MKVIACAGSGKTTTIICRVKYLIDQGVKPNQIIITTFNVEAGHHIKHKLTQLLGSTIANQLLIGNIDKVAYSFYIRFFAKSYYVGVKEYCREFLKYLKTKAGKNISQFYKYFFFDEFQDISSLQYQILLEFYQQGCKVIVIGDDAQTIYSWRGSKLEMIQTLVDKDIQNIQCYDLTTNYRSTAEIIQFSNQVIINSSNLIKKIMGYRNNHIQNDQNINSQQSQIQEKKQQKISYDQKKKPKVLNYKSLGLQNTDILNRVLDFRKKGINYNQIAILSPFNKPLKFLEEVFEKHNLNTLNIQINYLPLITQKDYSFQRQKQNKQKNNNSEADPFANDIFEQQIVLSTIHKSKGLEWDYVFVIGCNDDFFPGNHHKSKIEESRRLFYVAATRAAQQLYLSFICNNKYVLLTRYISEMLDSSDIKKYFEFDEQSVPGSSFNTEQLKQKQYQPQYITNAQEIITLLDDFHYYELRERKIIPELQDKTIIIHECYNYTNQILGGQLFQDLQNFVYLYFTRIIAEIFDLPEEQYQDIYANQVLNNLALNDEYLHVYEQNRDIIQNEINLGNIQVDTPVKDISIILQKYFKIGPQIKEEQIDNNNFMVIEDSEEEQEEDEETKQQNEMLYHTNKLKIQTIQDIIEAMQTVVYMNDLKGFSEINLCDTMYFPEEYDYSHFIDSYKNFKNKSIQTETIFRDIYNVSLLQQICDKRRRLLYRNIFESLICDQYMQMMKVSIKENFIQQEIVEKNPKNVEVKRQINNKQYGIETIIDLIVDDTAYNFRTSDNKKPQIEQVLAMLIAVCLYKIEKPSYEINYIAIYNCMQGTIVTFDISMYDQSEKLLKELQSARDIFCEVKNTKLSDNIQNDDDIENETIIEQINKKIQKSKSNINNNKPKLKLSNKLIFQQSKTKPNNTIFQTNNNTNINKNQAIQNNNSNSNLQNQSQSQNNSVNSNNLNISQNSIVQQQKNNFSNSQQNNNLNVSLNQSLSQKQQNINSQSQN